MTAHDLFSGFQIIEVEAGTEIEHDGQTLTVTDEAAVTKGRTIYITAKVFAALRGIGGGDD